MHYYQFHIGDFRGATLHLSNEEELAYRRALDWYYDTETPIPLETQWVSRRLRVAEKDLQTILADFFSKTEEGFVHVRCEQEIEHYRKLAEKNRSNGKKGGRPKRQEQPKENPMGFQPVASGKPDESESNPNQEPITKNQEPEKEKTPRKRSSTPAIQKPEGVTEQTWVDWLALRKLKKAVVSETVLASAMREAEKADLTLNEFLSIWCFRGSQGLQADWIKPSERPVRAQVESFRDADERKRRRAWEEMTGQQWPDDNQPGNNIIDITPSQQRIAK